MRFRATGLDKESRPANRDVEAASAEEALRLLSADWKQVSSVVGEPAPRPSRMRASPADLAFVTSHLASVVRTEMPIPRAVAELARDLRRGRLAQGLEQVARELENGKSLRDAFASRPDLFPPLLSATLVAGEKSGNLSVALSQLSEHFTLFREIRHRWIEAAVYPSIVLFLGLWVGWLLGTTVRSFRRVFLDLGRSLPPITQVTLYLGEHAHLVVACILLGLLAFVATGASLFTFDGGRRWVDRFLLRLPVVGRILSAGFVARFCHTMGMLLKNGVPVPESLDLCGPVLGSAVFRDAVADLRAHVLAGGGIARFVEMNPLFPNTISWMVSCGESRGDLPGALLEAGRLYAQEVRHRFAILDMVVAPFLLLVAGISVFGLMCLGLFLPLIDLIKAMS